MKENRTIETTESPKYPNKAENHSAVPAEVEEDTVGNILEGFQILHNKVHLKVSGLTH